MDPTEIVHFKATGEAVFPQFPQKAAFGHQND